MDANDKNTPLDVLLETYRFIFILYTEKFDKEDIGFSKEDLQKIRSPDKYPNIKIICNCEQVVVKEAFDRIDLDFKHQRIKHFENENSEYHEILRQLPMPTKKCAVDCPFGIFRPFCINMK